MLYNQIWVVENLFSYTAITIPNYYSKALLLTFNTFFVKNLFLPLLHFTMVSFTGCFPSLPLMFPFVIQSITHTC